MKTSTYISRDTLLRVFPKATTRILNCIENNPYEFYKHGVNTPIRLVHFFAQCGHETAGLTRLEEIGGGHDRYDGGKTYKGRGLIQLTGKANYTWIGNLLGVDFIDQPDKVSEPPYLLTTALEFWEKMGLNKLADADNGTKITRLINGGYNGLDDRLRLVAQLKKVIFS